MSCDIFEERHFVGDIMSRDIFAAILCHGIAVCDRTLKNRLKNQGF
jgi:hypothetical protein